ncbi:DUF3108 domain-containing protein [Psychroflexus gondwanensis]|jgi:hypothetical protein|uniref:DUF3108 domain-containing protein n=1 Tax=Psychroflexus gondwanensis ACAM 44 TaxID=1189619 RepID=N1WSQ0_9FLAO|nr:DUF3108 domain-containing protein [Psychroflexus gondwanensis]EMY80159.1 hypothetical protein pgond44_13267 [Psychroflexus gondwanensis ACAM 44]TXE18467.1 DUF3108 domain-containing protein [Psychroflexus gondwanensis]
MKFILSLVIAISSVFCSYSQSAYEDGEWLSFKIKYGWFNTSKATLEVRKTKLNNEDVHHIIGNGKSVGLLDVFFRVRDRYETFVNQDGLPVKFIRDINEGGYKKHKELYFNHNSQRVKVVDYKHKTTESFDFELNTQDMLSAFYKLRNSINIETLRIGQEFNLNMFFDNENYDFKTKFLGYEVLDTKFGKVACLKFRPYVKAERVFEAQESLTFWISADQNKIPLKIEAELAVGSLTAELDEFKGLSHSFEVIMD